MAGKELLDLLITLIFKGAMEHDTSTSILMPACGDVKQNLYQDGFPEGNLELQCQGPRSDSAISIIAASATVIVTLILST